jgi:hypothetical protein
MNSANPQHRIFRQVCALVVACSIFLAGCGGGGGSTETAGIGGTGIGVGGTGVVVGKITGFGSVHVNGGKFEIDTSQFDVDGDTGADQGDLALGMVIALEVEVENGVYTGKALKVFYDDEVEGPAIMLPDDPKNPTIKIGTVFGQTITFDEGSTIFAGTSFDSIGEEGVLLVPDVIEVSGFRISETEITATYVSFKKDLDPGLTDVELRGDIDQYVMGGTTFEIDGTVINFDPTGVNTEIEVQGGVISNGIYVEVKGVIQAGPEVDADKIEEEDEDFGEDVDDVSLQGVISNYVSDADFEIDGRSIDASTAKFSPNGLDLDDGLNIEVEGEIIGGKLIADEVELREGESELKSTIGAVDAINGWFEVTYPTLIPGSVIVRTNSQTVFEDETGAVPSETFSINDLHMNLDFVRVEGQEISNEVVASVVKRVNGAGESLKLEGAVDTFAVNSSITILGIIYGVDPTPGTGTDFDGFANSTDFFDALNPAGGDFVEIEDDDVADGIADEVELE